MDLADLNAQLLAGCRAGESHVPAGHAQAIGVGMAIAREQLLPVAAEGFDLSEVCFPTVDTLGRVKVRTTASSVPVAAGTVVQVKLSATTVAVWHEGRCVATHERCYGRHQEILNLEHYLDVLAHKPGAFAGSKPLAQWRVLGHWPPSYDRFWQALMDRQGKQAGTKAMVELLQLGRSHGQAARRRAIETALDLGVSDAAAVQQLLAKPQLEHAPPPALDVGTLGAYARPLPRLDGYDTLLAVAR
ncbi:MAG TPA: hypothetical protein VKV26_02380 [Dehalococcoidia bacterium]|nr:hypothetical protein [Dehalococcoidia bacterium]